MTKRNLMLFLIAAALGSAAVAKATVSCHGSTNLLLMHASTTVDGVPFIVMPKPYNPDPVLEPENMNDVSPAPTASLRVLDPDTGEMRHLVVRRAP